MGAFQIFLDRRSRAINIVINLCLLALCLVCYALLILLFLSPSVFQLGSLVNPRPSTIQPTVVVALLSALLTAATSALTTRAVEHSVWLKLAPRPIKKKITIGETYCLAQWSISPLARLWYFFIGHAWALKFAGLFLIGIAAINPVIISGISQYDESAVQSSRQTNQGSRWTGWLDASNILYSGGEFRDNPTVLAALLSMNNQSAPSADICSGDPLCTARATVTAIRATCNAISTDNPDGIGISSEREIRNQTFCSTINPDVCSTLVSSSPYTYANFTSGYPPDCNLISQRCPGSWSTIFGAYVNDPGSATSTSNLNMVDCALEFGNATITQSGRSSPSLIRDSFQRSPDQVMDIPGIVQWRRIYTSEATQSPFTFSALGTGTGTNSLYESAVAFSLLGPAANASADLVAARIEATFDMATLLAFSRAPAAADIAFERQVRTPVYGYDARVLLVLLVPALATVLSVCLGGRWRVGDAEDVVGYDPVEIARRGPVVGLEGRRWAERHEVETVEVCGWRDDGSSEGSDEKDRFLEGKMPAANVVAVPRGQEVARHRFMAAA